MVVSMKHPHSLLLRITMGAIYPFILIFGIYVIVNGHLTPGGGFQGGAILSSIFIIQYFTTYEKTVHLNVLNRIEKLLYLAIVFFAIIFIFEFNNTIPFWLKPYYLLLMNIIIGIKVCCGLSVIFYRFVLYESR